MKHVLVIGGSGMLAWRRHPSGWRNKEPKSRLSGRIRANYPIFSSRIGSSTRYPSIIRMMLPGGAAG